MFRSFPKCFNSLMCKRLNEFKQKLPIEIKNVNEIDLSLSFISHALGISLFHKPETKNEFNLSNEDFVVKFVKVLNQHNLNQDYQLMKFQNPECSKWKLNQFVITVDNKGFDGGIKLYRDDKVVFDYNRVLSYSNLLKNSKIKKTKDLLLKNRIDIMKCINDQKLTNNMVSFWFLIFGCEVIKNPAQLIHMNMAFDLVINDIIKFEELNFITPMMQQKILAPVMKLNSIYSNYMPFEYMYNDPKNDPVKDGDPGQVIEKEAFLTKEWLKLKLGKETAQDLLEETIDNDNALYFICNEIKNSFKDWNLNQLTENNIYLKNYDSSQIFMKQYHPVTYKMKHLTYNQRIQMSLLDQIQRDF